MTPSTSRTAACRKVAASLSRNAAARGWKVGCLSNTFRMPPSTVRFLGYTDVPAKSIYLAGGMSVTKTRAVFRRQATGIPAADLAPLPKPTAPMAPLQACERFAQGVRAETARLAPGWRVNCTTRELIIGGLTAPQGSAWAAWADSGNREILLRALDRSPGAYRGTWLHELGHAIQFGWSPAMRAAWDAESLRLGGDVNIYYRSPVEVWAESYRRQRGDTLGDSNYMTVTPGSVRNWLDAAARAAA